MERGLFRILFGAALVLAGWRAFWKWALPKPRRGAASVFMMNEALKQLYSSTIADSLRDTRTMMTRYLFGVPKPLPMSEYVARELKFDLPHEVAWRWIKRKLRPYKPVIMTTKKKEELEYYD